MYRAYTYEKLKYIKYATNDIIFYMSHSNGINTKKLKRYHSKLVTNIKHVIMSHKNYKNKL